MNPKRSNKTMAVLLLVMIITGALIISNVLFTMVTHKHYRSGVDVKEYKEPDTYSSNVLKANRGTIYDRNGEVIAKDEDTYTLVAILDENRKGINNTPAYVKDIDDTAYKLSKVLDLKETEISKILRDAREDGLYQTELGLRGKNLSAETKEKIDAMKLPGITFTKTVKRNYPQGTFASHLIGFASYDEESKEIQGQMGLEKTLNDYLSGEDGLEVYQKDVNGNVLAGTKHTEKYALNGDDVYLTLDSNVQLALQSSLQKTMKETKAKKAWGLVMEVETGKILGWASTPSFDLNERNIKDYLNVPSEYLYEPGSVMKGITYAAAIDSGNYPYDKTFRSGVFNYYTDDNGKIIRSETKTGLPPIYDALKKDHGTITFDKGFAVSSNIGICELLTKYLDPNIFKDYVVNKFNFTKKVDIPFIENTPGHMNFTYASEKLNTGFGQGISVNSLQMAQAYTAILNDGVMVRPYVVERIEDPNTGKVVEEYDTKVVGNPIKKSTSEYMRKLMKMVVEDKEGSGQRYKMDGVSVIAKTGTGQIANDKGQYGDTYTQSVMAAAPADDPKVMVYYIFESPYLFNDTGTPFKETMKAALVSSNISGESESESNEQNTSSSNKWEEYQMPSLVNHSTEYVEKKLKEMDVNIVKIGNGKSVLRQFPEENTSINSNGKVFLLTDGNTITMPDMKGWTKKDITAFWNLTGIAIEMEGNGSVTKQNVKAGKTISKDTQIKVTMK